MHLRQVSTMYNLMILKCYDWIYTLLKKCTCRTFPYGWASDPVMEDTIEEQMVALHGRKRQLAEDLLAGSDGVGRLDTQVLLAVLRKGGE